MSMPFDQHIYQMLQLGKKIINTSPLLSQETGTVNVKGDKTIEMDVKIENELITYIKENNLPFNIFSEEIGTMQYHSHPTHTIVFDPLDGSTNYKLGKNLLPYGLLIACFRGLNPQLKDVVTSGAIEYTTQLGWIYDGHRTTTLEGQRVILDKDWIINSFTPVYFDLYYKKAYDAFAPLAQQLHIRWSGSNIGSLTYTMAQVSAAMGAYQMRPEEIGTMVSLIKGAGGIAVDHKGNDLGEYVFSSESVYQIIAGNKAVVEFAIRKLSKV